MEKERDILRRLKTDHKEKLEGLKHFVRELKEQCHDCDTAHDHVNQDLLKAENDAQFYETRIKSINQRIRELGSAKKK
jgi:hypothetical protein